MIVGNFATFDIMASLIFGLNYHTLSDESCRHVIKDIHESNVRVSVLMQALELRFARLDRILFPRSIEARNSFLQFVRTLLRDKKAVTGKTNDVFSLLSSAVDPETGSKLSADQLAAESVTLIVAGKFLAARSAMRMSCVTETDGCKALILHPQL